MDDRDFFDKLLQLWANTTNCENTYWGYEETLEEQFDIFSVSDVGREFVGYVENEADADWITALHGCFPDLVRRLHEALDEADRLDYEMDEVQDKLMEAELKIAELKDQLKENNG